ncbi:ABC transporter permease [Nocardia amamiensis]|uniref:ABC transporter permease n=1 Tax=Nocardia amamiensis TaxID=404578 RepID=UPI0033F4D64D
MNRSVLPYVRAFVTDYARNPVNLVVLVLVPALFVFVAAGTISDAMELLGGIEMSVETATVGWSAGFLAGLAMYFQIRAARAADRRLVIAGLAPGRLVAARAATGLVLAVLVSAVSLAALAARTGLDHPLRTIAGTLMFAVIYLAIGAVIGVLATNPVNGAVLVLFVWIIDVFFGPSRMGTDQTFIRWLPTHFVTLWMIDLPSGHGGRITDLGYALLWLIAAVAVGSVVLARAARAAPPARRPSGQLVTGLRLGLVDLRRNPALLALLVVVPVVFILLAKVTTPERTIAISVRHGDRTVADTFWFPEVHAGTMAPIAVAALATLAGLFVVADSEAGDRRLRLAGYRRSVLLAVRFGVLTVAVAVIGLAALAITATVFTPAQWAGFITALMLAAITYALIGMILAPLFGRVAGVFVAFLIPFLDLGLIQSPMLRPEPAPWARFWPGYASTRLLFDTGLTTDFDLPATLLLALAWPSGLVVIAAVLFGRGTRARPRLGI